MSSSQYKRGQVDANRPSKTNLIATSIANNLHHFTPLEMKNFTFLAVFAVLACALLGTSGTSDANVERSLHTGLELGSETAVSDHCGSWNPVFSLSLIECLFFRSWFPKLAATYKDSTGGHLSVRYLGCTKFWRL